MQLLVRPPLGLARLPKKLGYRRVNSPAESAVAGSRRACEGRQEAANDQIYFYNTVKLEVKSRGGSKVTKRGTVTIFPNLLATGCQDLLTFTAVLSQTPLHGHRLRTPLQPVAALAIDKAGPIGPAIFVRALPRALPLGQEAKKVKSPLKKVQYA